MVKLLIFSDFGFQSVDGIFLSGINSQQESPEMQIPGLEEEYPSSDGWWPVRGEETTGTN